MKMRREGISASRLIIGLLMLAMLATVVFGTGKLIAANADTGISTGIPIAVSLSDATKYEYPRASEKFAIKLKITPVSAKTLDGSAELMAVRKMPVPADKVIELPFPEGVGTSYAVGYTQDDPANPWKLTFTEDGVYTYDITQEEIVDGDGELDSRYKNDSGIYTVMAIVEDGQTKLTFRVGYKAAVSKMQPGDFNFVDASTIKPGSSVKIDEEGTTILNIGGNRTYTYDFFDLAAVKSYFPIDFTRSFKASGWLVCPSVPDGCVIGFASNPQIAAVNGGGDCGVYDWSHYSATTNEYSLIMEFDTYDNGNAMADNGLGAYHMVLTKTDGSGRPTQACTAGGTGHEYNWPTERTRYEITYDINTKIITFHVDLPNPITLTFEDPVTNAFNGKTDAYFMMTGAVRQGPRGSYGIDTTSSHMKIAFEQFNYLDRGEGTEFEDLSVTGVGSSDIETLAFTIGYKDDSHLINFNANGGTGGTTSMYVREGYKIKNLENPTREGYKLLGWSTVQNAKGPNYDIKAAVYEPANLYAVWKIIPNGTLVFNKADLDENNILSFPNAVATFQNGSKSMSKAYSITVDVTDGYIITEGTDNPAPSNADLLTFHKTATWLFPEGITASQVQTFVRNLRFNFVLGMDITVSFDGNEGNTIPAGSTISSVIHGDGTTHYYVYVRDYGATWFDAYNGAKSSFYMGMRGYLATITEVAEDIVIDNLTLDCVWAGAVRVDSGTTVFDVVNAGTHNSNTRAYIQSATSKWVWSCGPEAGTEIRSKWNTSAPGYSNWNTGQPDGQGTGEYCMTVHFGQQGEHIAEGARYGWNDLNSDYTYNNVNGSAVSSHGYLIEFSDYPGAFDGTGYTYSAANTVSETFRTHVHDIEYTQGCSYITVQCHTTEPFECDFVNGFRLNIGVDEKNPVHQGTVYVEGLEDWLEAGLPMPTLVFVETGFEDEFPTSTFSTNPGTYRAELTVTIDRRPFKLTREYRINADGSMWAEKLRRDYITLTSLDMPVGLLYGEIDYDVDFILDTIVYASDENGEKVENSFINLTTEHIQIAGTYGFYSTNGGKTWSAYKKLIDDKKLKSMLDKGFELALAVTYDKKTKKATDVIKFAKINKRPKKTTLKVNYLIYADDTGFTNGHWTVAVHNVEAAVHNYWFGEADSTGKKLGDKGYGLWPYMHGVWVKDLVGGKQASKTYYYKTPAYGTTPSCKTAKFKVSSILKPTKAKVNYSYETFTLPINTMVYYGAEIADTRSDKEKLIAKKDPRPFQYVGSGKVDKATTTYEELAGKAYFDTTKPTKLELAGYINENRNTLIIWKRPTLVKPAAAKQVIELCARGPAATESTAFLVKSGTIKLKVSKTEQYQAYDPTTKKWKQVVTKPANHTVVKIRRKLTAKGGKESDSTYAIGYEAYLVLERGVYNTKTKKMGIVGYKIFDNETDANAYRDELIAADAAKVTGTPTPTPTSAPN